MEYSVGQQVAPGLIVVHEATLTQLREQADAKNDLRRELHRQDEKVLELTDALNKIHDLAGQMSGPNPHPHLGAIQDWCHRVLGECRPRPSVEELGEKK